MLNKNCNIWFSSLKLVFSFSLFHICELTKFNYFSLVYSTNSDVITLAILPFWHLFLVIALLQSNKPKCCYLISSTSVKSWTQLVTSSTHTAQKSVITPSSRSSESKGVLLCSNIRLINLNGLETMCCLIIMLFHLNIIHQVFLVLIAVPFFL